MQHQKAVYLQEMGITRWQLRKPQLFPNYNPTSDISHASLLVVCCDSDIKMPLMEKILSAFSLDKTKVEYFSMQQFEDYQGSLPTFIWSTLGEINSLQEHQVLISPTLTTLNNDPHAKKSLWKQFCALKK